jgi:hypothetical protein
MVYMRLYALAFAVFLAPQIAFGQIVITEIMYDLDGADSGHEWIEIQNIGSDDVDLDGWKLRENGTNHTLTFSASTVLVSGAVAVIADNSVTFQSDWPVYSGTLIDSSFSLNNTGESLELLDADLAIVDTVTYSDSWRADGDGNSLQFDGNNWLAAVPTPGTALTTDKEGGAIIVDEGEQKGEVVSAQPASSPPSGGFVPVSIPKIQIYAGEDRQVTVGAMSAYEGAAIGEDGEPIVNARFLWNFGDGNTREGQHILHHYTYPGEYAVWLAVAAGVISVGDRVNVTAIPGAIVVSEANAQYVELTNMDNDEINLSWWIIKSADSSFSLPENTILLASSSVRFPSSTTGLFPVSTEEVSLRYPNDRVVENSHLLPLPTPPPQLPVKIVEVRSPPIRQTVESVTVEVDSDVGTTSTVAPVANAQAGLPDGNNVSTIWILALVGLVTLGLVAILARERRESDEYTIVE